jgi:hypothetical protein
LLAGSALALGYAWHFLSLLPLALFFSFDYLFLGAGRVSESLFATALHGPQVRLVNRFGNLQQMVIESMGALGLAAGGILLATGGFGTALGVYPLLILTNFTLAILFLKLPEALPSHGSPGWRAQIKTVWKTFQESPLLRKAAIAYTLNGALTAFVYFTIAPIFGLFASAHELMTAPSATFWTAFSFAAGGLAGTLLNSGLDAQAEEAGGKALEQEQALHLRTARWLSAGAIALTGAWAFLLASPGATFAFMALFGLTGAGILVHLETLLKTGGPPESRGSLMGMLRASAYVAAALGFPALGWVFDYFSTISLGIRVPAPEGFAALAAILTGAGAVYLWAARGLRGSR